MGPALSPVSIVPIYLGYDDLSFKLDLYLFSVKVNIMIRYFKLDCIKITD